MRFFKTTKLTLRQKQELLQLWNNEYPQTLQYNNLSEFDEYLNKLKDPRHILLLDEHDNIKGWYSDFIRDNDKWFLAILNTESQGQKFGTEFIKMGKEMNEELNGWIINSNQYLKKNGQFYKSPIDFYRKQGFEILEDITLKTEQLNAIKIKWSKINQH